VDNPIITIYCAFTRGWVVERWLDNLKNLDYDRGLINLAFIIDIDDPYIAINLGKEERNYRGFRIRINRDWQPNEVRPIERRKRIAVIKNQSKKLISELDSDLVLGLEDDTVFEDLNLKRFINKLKPDTGIIEGVQCGRWNSKMIGAWKFDDIDDPTEVVTLLPGKGFEEIDAGGFYGYLISRENYLAIPYQYNGEPWGPDVNAGIWLRKQRLTNYIDWETKFGHNDHNVLIKPDSDIIQYKFKKLNDTWVSVIP